MFERGVSDVSRMPQAPMTDAQIASAAAASKTGAGIWLLSHAKEILIGAVSFTVGVGGTLLATHTLGDRNTTSQPAQSTVIVVSADTTMLADDTVSAIDETSALSNTPVETWRGTSSTTTSQNASQETFHGTSLKTAQPAATPVIVTKTVIRRDTVHIHETITIKDTVYVP
ncbi:MAG: hypothetical protein J6T86_03355 [Bacteroidales bacterium]|nr:hypothetical protein [Bacteroidales bacterium]